MFKRAALALTLSVIACATRADDPAKKPLPGPTTPQAGGYAFFLSQLGDPL